ncbi:MAG: ribosome small subunit-dependent GTPase A [Planctomycetota bacterium]|jgi:ribosome biogenesis GTPase
MARRKGKSQRRIKDWDHRYRTQESFEHTEALRGRFTRREVKLPERELAVGAEALDDLPRKEGMVVGLFPGGSVVLIEGERIICSIAGTFRAAEGSSALAVGDVVSVALARTEHVDGPDEIDKDRSDGVILERQPRRTALSRPQVRSGKRRNEYETETFEKVIAANMDVLLIVASTREPPLRHGLIDRFLIIAERGELQPVLLINKIDLKSPDKKVLADFKSLDVEVFLCSVKRGKGLRKLTKRLVGHQSVLGGASGVGKTTLINAIVPDADAPTRQVRPSDERGRHTTSSAEVYELPGGGLIVDTPGMRELGIALDATELPWYFPEFEALAGECKFRNCTHIHEPDCAVIKAVETAQIPQRRYQSYLNILDTLGENTA